MDSDRDIRYFPFSNIDKSIMATSDLSKSKVTRYHSIPHSETSPAADPSCRPVGLQNLGSTCWFNVAVQILYHIPTFRQAILEFKIPPQLAGPCQPFEFISGLQELFVSIMYSERKLIDPTRAVGSIGKLLGGGQGQQDASEFLGVLLNRIREVNPAAVELFFIGSYTSVSPNGNNGCSEEFMQYTLPAHSDSSLLMLLSSSLCSEAATASKEDPLSQCRLEQPPTPSKLFCNLPSIFMVDLCRMVNGASPVDIFKVNHSISFPSLIFMDRFQLENFQTVSTVNATLEGMSISRREGQQKLKHLSALLQNIPQLKPVYDHYLRIVEQQSTVKFDLLNSLNVEWETEIQVTMNTLHRQSTNLSQKIEFVQSRDLPTLRPYQLHAIVVHRGESTGGGHYWTYVWDSQHQLWFHIDDNFTQQVTWDVVANAAFGGTDKDSSAHSLIYLDALKSDSLLNTREDYVIGPTDVLRYLKDNTDVRTRHAAYGKSQTLKAALDVVALGNASSEAPTLLYRALNSERKRLYSLYQEWADQSSVEEEVRLLHFGVYLLANHVAFEPYVYWTLLQHFSGFNQLTEQEYLIDKTSGVCTAARHALAFVENSSTQEQKKLFIQWNTAYHQFRLVVRHVMNGITHVFSRNFSAALPLAVKALYLHHGLVKSSLNGPAMSINPGVIHSLIEKSVTSLSEELLENDLDSVSDVACSVLFNSIVNWCEYSDRDNLEAARSSSRRIADHWGQRVKSSAVLAAECASASGLRTVADIQRKLAKVESVLDQPDENGNPTPFDFKGHIPDNPDDGEKLAAKWKQMWLICIEQRLLSLSN